MVTEALSSGHIHWGFPPSAVPSVPSVLPVNSNDSRSIRSVRTRGRCLKCCPWGSLSLSVSGWDWAGWPGLLAGEILMVEAGPGRGGGRACTVRGGEQPHSLCRPGRACISNRELNIHHQYQHWGGERRGGTTSQAWSQVIIILYCITPTNPPLTPDSRTQLHIIYISICLSSFVLIFKVRE